MRDLILLRDIQTVSVTLGYFQLDGSRLCDTLEKPWRDNAANVSCIPCGRYPLRWTYSESKQRMLWLVDGVPGRSGIRIHSGNSVHDTDGCIVVGGLRSQLFNGVEQSRNALANLHVRLASAFPAGEGGIVIAHEDSLISGME